MSSRTLQGGGKSSGAGSAPILPALTPRLPLTRGPGENLPQTELGSRLLPWSHLGRARVRGWIQHAPGTGTAAGSYQGSEETIRRGRHRQHGDDGVRRGHLLGVRLVKG